ncbi:hypothetical protein YDYSY3_08820 [Paenibacillus chitinolyticus]|nr:hypothetical protein YDYSY3_08820 [Paenibacillus chitinolyticus]
MNEGWLRAKPEAVRIFSQQQLKKLRTAEGPEFFVLTTLPAAATETVSPLKREPKTCCTP